MKMNEIYEIHGTGGKNQLSVPVKINPYRRFVSRMYRALTTPFRTLLPDFIIIGAAKAGTTSLYDYLIQHPDIYCALQKETFYFVNLRKRNWRLPYRSYFPTYFTKFSAEYIHKRKFLTGEATPGYLFFPHCVAAIHRVLPNAKLIVILRNPVDRAFSQYHFFKNRGKDSHLLTFEDAIANEKTEFQKIGMSKQEYLYNFPRSSYLSRGIYVEQLENWFKFYPEEQFFICSIEEMSGNAQNTISKIYEFLDVENHILTDLKIKNVGQYRDSINPETREQLIEYFRPYNEKLYKLLGKQFDWDK
jgi:hypothetical protein